MAAGERESATSNTHITNVKTRNNVFFIILVSFVRLVVVVVVVFQLCWLWNGIGVFGLA